MLSKEIEKEVKFSLSQFQYESFLCANFSHQETYVMNYFDTKDDEFLRQGNTFRYTEREDPSKNRVTFKKFLHSDQFRVCEELHWAPQEFLADFLELSDTHKDVLLDLSIWNWPIIYEDKALYKKSEIQTYRRHLVLPDLKAELDKCIVRDKNGAEIKTFYEIEFEDQEIPLWITLYERDDTSKYEKSRNVEFFRIFTEKDLKKTQGVSISCSDEITPK